jgi:heme-degrading monooxygenase HmoA
MFARIGSWEGSAEEMERWVARSRRDVKPAVQSQPGVRGALWLLDRTTGRGLTITLWENEEALRASDGLAASVQAGTNAASGARVTTSRYEIVESFRAD